MKQLQKDIKQLWRERQGFRASVMYLLFLTALVILLPILPLPYAPNELDMNNLLQKPSVFSGGNRHWLGTDALGRDVLVNVLFGARSAFMISFPVMILSTGIGVFVGVSAGYFGNSRLKITRAGLVLGGVAALLLFYFGLYLPTQLYRLSFSPTFIGLSLIVLIITLALLKLILPTLYKIKLFKTETSFPLDYFTLRVIEAVNSIPNFLLILVLVSFLPPSVFLLSLIIVLVSWTSTARLARAEILKISNLPYFEAAKSLGMTQKRLLIRHALPNMLGPVVITFSFGLASLLALESTLSFLGIGVPSTFVSWGRTIAGIRANTSAWWLVLFPGSALAITVLALQSVSYHLLNVIQQKKLQ